MRKKGLHRLHQILQTVADIQKYLGRQIGRSVHIVAVILGQEASVRPEHLHLAACQQLNLSFGGSAVAGNNMLFLQMSVQLDHRIKKRAHIFRRQHKV